MIISRIQKHKRPIVALLTWLMAMETTLPAFATTAKVNINYSDTPSKTSSKIQRNDFPHNKEKSIIKALPSQHNAFKNNSQLLLNSSGPSQPETSTFKSVGSDNMVDPFTGDFSYNIPLLDVGGYPINIHYNSNITMDQEASWVGLGWNLNPGAISRTMRGLPDDFNGSDIISKTLHTKPNINLSVGVDAGIEAFGKDLGLGGNLAVTYDNYRGYGLETGLSLRSPIRFPGKSAGHLSGGLSFGNSSSSGLSIVPDISYESKIRSTGNETEQGETRLNFKGSLNYNSRAGLTSLSLSADGNRQRYSQMGASTDRDWSIPGSMSFSRPTFTPSTEIPYTSLNFSFNVKTGLSIGGLFGNIGFNASVSRQYIPDGQVTKKYSAFGYLHYNEAAGNKNALLDYNRENDGTYVDKVTPAIAIPNYTYDVYTISAEGTGGSFRPYRSDIGYVYSTFNKTDNAQLNVGFDAGVQHFGANIKPVYSTTTTNAWLSDNRLKDNISFQEKDSVFENVVFRNPMEMPIQSQGYLDAIGHDTLIRPILEGSGVNATLGNGFAIIPNTTNSLYNISLKRPIVKDKREKRNQVISYLTAAEASEYGLEKKIASYNAGYIPYTSCAENITYITRIDSSAKLIRKAHHISEVTVLNSDGKRYLYGIPAYTLNQQNITFSVDKKTTSSTDNVRGLTSYTDAEITTSNTSGVDGYFSKEEIPSYAHSFLLSGILSPDYIDVTGNGITDDDLGDAVKFNYTCIYDQNNPFGWRTPSDTKKAALNEGLKTYSRDDKASIVFGEKEEWYVHSIISKNLVAVFKTSKKRPDAISVASVNGEKKPAQQLVRLERIDLYSKADLVANGANAKPIKSVWFEYDSSLCPGAAEGQGIKYVASGKLTLKKIYFTYNGNDNKKVNPYIFNYKGLNPGYSPKHNDNWGNYKNTIYNPGGLSNQDYPYIIQENKNEGDKNAAAWCLTDIQLPSGGSIKVTYESDDYGFVQNKRAMQLYKIAGIGKTENDKLRQTFYDGVNSTFQDYNIVFIDVNKPVYNNEDVYSGYLEGIKSLYLKFSVKMPSDVWGSGYEFVPMVCDVDSYGLVNNNRIWIKIKSINGKNPFLYYALQFLKESLPSKAYPGSETGSNPDLKGLVNVITSQFTTIQQAVKGFDNAAIANATCKVFEPSKSFIKLNNSNYIKLGGGSRVKKIEIFDNFDRMTGNQMKGAIYGQEYDYSTTKTVNENRHPKIISISSGVASYEPFIGGEENALKSYYAYQQQINALGPVSYKFVDTPFCESFYPSASVGYSKVTIKTINKKFVSANGKEVYTFYTYKDFPTRFSFTSFDDNSRKRYQPAISNFLKINAQHYLTLSQGFKVELNDMHGKLHSHAFYSEADNNNPLTYTENVYRTETKLGQGVNLDGKVWSVGGPEAEINTSGSMGQSAELMVDLREQSGYTISPNIELNVDLIGLFFPIPGIQIWPQWEKTRFRSASVLKVVNNYGILDSVYSIDKGSFVGTKNLIYDSETGNVVLTRTNNEFKDPVYNYTYPAHWIYSGMDMAYKNIHAQFGRTPSLSLNIKNGRLFDGNDKLFAIERYFESGDECIIKGTRSNTQLGDPDCGFSMPFLPVNDTTKRAWVLDANKKTDKSSQLFFIDEDGKPLNVKDAQVKILRSGKRNFTEISVGSVTMLNSPIVEDAFHHLRVIIADENKVINTSATTFKDCWKVDNSFYAKDSCFKKLDTVFNRSYTPETSLLMKTAAEHGETQYEGNVSNSMNLNAGLENIFTSRNRSKTFRSKSIIKFNFSNIPKGAKIINAFLNLYGRWAKEVWTGEYGEDWSSYDKAHYNQRHDSDDPDNNASVLQRIHDDWDPNKGYHDIVLDPSQTVIIPSTPDNTCIDRTNIDVSLLVENMIGNSANYGLMMSLKDPNNNSSNSSKRIMTFCTGVNTSTNLTNNFQFSQTSSVEGNCSTCILPSLNVSYEYQKDTCVTVCKKNITDSINPYRWGVYGNWRTDKSYVFYSNRKESNPSASTDVRNSGTLKDFVPFWIVTDGAVKPIVDSNKWVWNSATTLVNSKGAEVENVDPLKRYNSGQYGYNNQIAVAVTQNSRQREAAFDGFEDYQYKDNYCKVICPNPRFADFVKGGGILTKTVSHTGLYSLSLPPGTQSQLQFPLYSELNDTTFPCVSCGVKTKVDSISLVDTVVTAKGMGLNLTFTDMYGNPLCNSNSIVASVDFSASNYSDQCPEINGPNGYIANWVGFIQPNSTGQYMFNPNYFGDYVNVSIVDEQSSSHSVFSTWGGAVPITLIAGRVYGINIQFSSSQGNGFFQLKWQNNSLQNVQTVPAQNLYSYEGGAEGTVETNFIKWCVRIHPPSANIDTFLILPPFSPVKGKKVLISAWLKEDQPCSGTAYSNAKIQVSFDIGSQNVTLQPTGAIIEGWQRLEGTVNIPQDANNLKLSMFSINSTSGFYVDDIRIHPFNANMKSFVYNPINLKLMAESDENNYASFYEYDDDGTLIRVKKETERGIKTIKETRSAQYKSQ